MKIVQCSQQLLNPISLPGMGRSVELADLSTGEAMEIRTAYSAGELYISFDDEPEQKHAVINMWANPHSVQLTLFIK